MAEESNPALFSTGPTPDLIVEDVYAPAGPKNKPGPATASEELKEEVKTSVGSYGKNIKGLAEDLKIEDGKLGVDKKLATERLIDSTGNLASPISRMGVDVLDSLMGKMGVKGQSPKDIAEGLGEAGKPGKGFFQDKEKAAGLLRVVMDDRGQTISRLVNDADFKSAKGIKDLLGALGSTAEMQLFDLDAQFAVADELMEKLNKYGGLDALDIVLEKIEDDKDKKRYILSNLPTLFNRCDIRSIRKAIDWVGASAVMRKVPNGIVILMQQYRMPSGQWTNVDRREEIREDFDLFLDTLNRLDDKWRVTTWNGNEVLNLAPYQAASFELVTASEHNREEHMRFKRSKRFLPASVSQWASRTFKYVRIAS